MKDVLDEIVAWKRIEVERAKSLVSEREMHARVERMLGGEVPSMAKAIRQSDTGIIAEFKRKSPSKGWIKESGQPETIPTDYQSNGAAAISILTDEKYFGGNDAFITTARQSGVNIPILYKNFVIDEYQLFQARLCGASAVLLIAACLTKDEYRQLLRTAHELQLEVLLETHSTPEVEYADHEPDLCGVNNRNLGTFITDVSNSMRLATMLPQNIVRVSESGISNPQTICGLKKAGYEGFLIGENFMKTDNPGLALNSFIQEIGQCR